MIQGRIIDCCSLINLHTGWGGLSELSTIGWKWHLCEAVMREAEHTREFGEDGSTVVVPLDMGQLVDNAVMGLVAPVSDEEMTDYLDFACEVDDGEAQALAIAKCRGYTLLTDDRKAMRLAARPDVNVATISTAEVLRVWASLDVAYVARLAEVIRRIEDLARFAPRKDSPDYAWWVSSRTQR
ncbi:MAG: hypothetical protein RQ757_04195 [Pseudomonadales bacterium]|nr:hypothetical protein [Pseudomonadales bacterium]